MPGLLMPDEDISLGYLYLVRLSAEIRALPISSLYHIIQSCHLMRKIGLALLQWEFSMHCADSLHV